MSRQRDFDDEREWLAQERALHLEREGAAASEEGVAQQYRLVARALRNPPLAPMPNHFAAQTAAYVERESRLAGERVEVWLERVLVLLLVIAGVAATAVYYGESLRELASAVPEPFVWQTFVSWSLAIASCIGISWVIEQATKR